jgi:hypothetical protein
MLGPLLAISRSHSHHHEGTTLHMLSERTLSLQYHKGVLAVVAVEIKTKCLIQLK